MSKEYIFKYGGSKESFLSLLASSSHAHNSGFYYLEDYVVEVLDDEIRFNIEGQSRSGRCWFISKFVEENNQIEFKGKIQYTDPEENRTKVKKVFDIICDIILWIVFFPLVVIILAIYEITRLMRKIRKISEPPTAEENLLELMGKYLNCERINDKTKS